MYAEVNGKKIFFDVIGEGLDSATPELKKKPTFITFHCASGFDHGYLRPGLDQLSLIGQVVYIDLPGSGRSALPDVSKVTFESNADDIVALMDYIGIEKAHIIGHCAGGFVAQHFALRHPERLDSLILVNTAPSFEKIVDEIPNPTIVERAPQEVVEACVRVYGQGDITEETVAKCFEFVGPYFMAQKKMTLFSSVFCYTAINIAMMDRFVNHIYKTYDVRDALRNIKAKTLIIAGSLDWLTPPSGARYIHSQIKGSQYIEFPNSCHMSFVEEREEFLKAIQKFIDNK